MYRCPLLELRPTRRVRLGSQLMFGASYVAQRPGACQRNRSAWLKAKTRACVGAPGFQSPLPCHAMPAVTGGVLFSILSSVETGVGASDRESKCPVAAIPPLTVIRIASPLNPRIPALKIARLGYQIKQTVSVKSHRPEKNCSLMKAPR